MSKARKPTAAQAEQVIIDYERHVYNKVKRWLRGMGEEGEPIADTLDSLHHELRVLRDDIAQGHVAWEE